MEAKIPEGGRLFACALCNKVVRICRCCDRGQHYCSKACFHKARRASVREAGRRYQETKAGRRGNARRQRDFYRRRKLFQKNQKNLTHQGSTNPLSPSIMVSDDTAEASDPFISQEKAPYETETVQRQLVGTWGSTFSYRDVPSIPIEPDCCDFCGRPFW